MQVDLLIVGQGLGGSVLACEALHRGLSVAVIDNGWKSAASTVAAGMWNPISFRKIIPVWRDEACMQSLEEAYPHYEEGLGAKFFHSMPIARVFPNEEYASLWKKKIDEGMKWISLPEEPFKAPVVAPFGHGLVNRAGYLDMPVFLSAVREKLMEEEAFVEEEFDEDALRWDKGFYKYKSIEAKKVVLAAGLAGKDFKSMVGLPLNHNKGEVLEVKTTEFQEDIVLNNGKWLQPRGNGVFRLGSTYDWKDATLDTLPESKAILLEKVGKMFHAPIEVIEHIAGQRPTVRDRRPLLGRLDDHQLYSFNGLGTRGVLIAPLLAKELFNFMDGLADLHPETNLLRFRKRN